MDEFNSEYEIQMRILDELGGDTSIQYSSPYDVQLSILRNIEGGGGGIPEAPIDGKTYGRKDAGWEEIVPESVERLIITDGDTWTEELESAIEDKIANNELSDIVMIQDNIEYVPSTHLDSVNAIGLRTYTDDEDRFVYLNIDSQIVGQAIEFGEVVLNSSVTLPVAFYTSGGEVKETGQIEVISVSDNIAEKYLVTQDFVEGEIHLAVSDLTGTITEDSTNELLTVTLSQSGGLISTVDLMIMI